MLWHYTAEFTPQGDVSRAGVDEIADALGWPKDATLLIDALVNSGWVDRSDSGVLEIHDWAEHAEDAVHMKLARSRLCFTNGTPPKLSRLPRFEREQAEVFYGVSVRTDLQNVHTASARRAHGVHTEANSQVTDTEDDINRAHGVHTTYTRREFSRARGKGIGIGLGEGNGTAHENGNGNGKFGVFDIKPLADKLWHLHPSPSQFGSVEQALDKQIRTYPETKPEAFAEKITASMEAWAAYWLTEKRHATGIVKWITDGDYARTPPIKKRAPRSDAPETSTQVLEREARQNEADEAARIARRATKAASKETA